MDSIIAKGLTFTACHGVLPQEKTCAQQFVVDLILYLDLKAAGLHDDLKYSVDYSEVYEVVKNIVEGPTCNLLEALAEKIAQTLLKKFPIAEVEITLYKPQAPVKGKFDYFAVKIRRSKDK